MKHIASAIVWLGLLAAIVYMWHTGDSAPLDWDLWEVGKWIVVIPSLFVVSMGLAFGVIALGVFGFIKLLDWFG